MNDRMNDRPATNAAKHRGCADPAPAQGPTLGMLVHDVARLMRRRFEQHARGAGLPLTRTQCAVLLHVARDEGMSQAALAQLLDIEPITLVRLLDRLQAAGLIERCIDPGDRRVRKLYLTPAAVPALEDIRKIGRAVRDEALVGMPAAAQDALVHGLWQVKANLCGRISAEASATETPPAGERRAATGNGATAQS